MRKHRSITVYPDPPPPEPIPVLDNEHHGPEFIIEKSVYGWVIKSGPRGGDMAEELKGLFTRPSFALEAIHRYKMNNTNYKLDESKHVA
jgi:hypothetical protein